MLFKKAYQRKSCKYKQKIIRRLSFRWHMYRRQYTCIFFFWAQQWTCYSWQYLGKIWDSTNANKDYVIILVRVSEIFICKCRNELNTSVCHSYGIVWFQRNCTNLARLWFTASCILEFCGLREYTKHLNVQKLH